MGTFGAYAQPEPSLSLSWVALDSFVVFIKIREELHSLDKSFTPKLPGLRETCFTLAVDV